MNRIHIKERLLKHLGSLETDKGFLVDNFISKLFDMLKVGQGIKIDSVGYFVKIESKVSSINALDEEESDVINVIVFSENEKLNDYISEEQIFFEPTRFEYKYEPNENLFSLSIGRDYLSNEFLKSGNLFLPVSEEEYHNLLESKLENLFNNSIVIDVYQNEIPCLIISLENKNFNLKVENSSKPKEEFIQQSSLVDENINLELTDDKTLDFWDGLVDESSKKLNQYENYEVIPDESFVQNDDSILNTSQQTDTISEKSDIEKKESIFDDLLKLEETAEQINLDTSFSDLSEYTPESSVETSTDVSMNEIKLEEVEDLDITGEISWDKIISEIISDDEKIELPSFFQSENETIPQDQKAEDYIESLTGVVDNEKEDLSGNKETEITDVFDEVISEIHKQENEESASFSSEDSFNKVDEIIDKTIDEIQETTTEESVDEKQFRDQAVDSELSKDISDEKHYEAVEEEFSTTGEKKVFTSEKTQTETIKKKSNKIWTFLIVLVFLISSGVVYYSFKDYFKTTFSSVELINPSIKDASVISIEREYDIPVTYPYPPNENQTHSKLNIEQKAETKTIDKPSEITKKEIEKNIEPEKKITIQDKATSSVANTEKISETISKIGETYIAQIASFKSEMIAQKEVDRIKLKGYSAFVEKTEIPTKGTWYRVKVSGFKSVNEAQNFQTKYNKGEI